MVSFEKNHKMLSHKMWPMDIIFPGNSKLDELNLVFYKVKSKNGVKNTRRDYKKF